MAKPCGFLQGLVNKFIIYASSLRVNEALEKKFLNLNLFKSFISLISSRLLQNISIFLLMERLEYFLIRIIFLSMGEPLLIPTELLFLDLNPPWRRFAVEQLCLPYLCCDSMSVRRRCDVAVFVGFHYGIFSIQFYWENNFNIHFTWYWEFITLPNTFDLPWYVTKLLLCPRSSTVCST